MKKERNSWKLPITAVITTSAFAASEAFVLPTSVPRTPLHVHVPQSLPLTPPRTPTSTQISATSCIVDPLTSSSDLKSFLSSDADKQLLRKNCRYGGRATGTGGSSNEDDSCIYSDFGDDSKASGRAVLGFDLKMVSRSMDSSEFPTLEESDDYGSRRRGKRSSTTTSRNSGNDGGGIQTTFGLKIEKMNNPSPIKKRIASNLQSRYNAEQSRRVRDGIAPAMEELSNTGLQTGESSVPGWFPFTPTRSQVERLKVIELKAACQERGLPKVREYMTWSF